MIISKDAKRQVSETVQVSYFLQIKANHLIRQHLLHTLYELAN